MPLLLEKKNPTLNITKNVCKQIVLRNLIERTLDLGCFLLRINECFPFSIVSWVCLFSYFESHDPNSHGGNYNNIYP